MFKISQDFCNLINIYKEYILSSPYKSFRLFFHDYLYEEWNKESNINYEIYNMSSFDFLSKLFTVKPIRK